MATTKVLISAPQDRERRSILRMTGRYLMSLERDGHQEASAKLVEIWVFCGAFHCARCKVSKRVAIRGIFNIAKRWHCYRMDPAPEQLESLHAMAAQEDVIHAMEPERIVRASVQGDLGEYVREGGEMQLMLSLAS